MKLLLCLSILCWLSSHEARAQAAGPTDTSQFTCRLRPTKPVYNHKEPVAFTIEVRNKTAKPQLLVRSVWGSDAGWCFPTVAFEVYRVRNGPPQKIERLRNGLIDQLEVKDFVLLRPGEALDPCTRPGDDGPGFFAELYDYLPPGYYEVYFTYSTLLTQVQQRNLFSPSASDVHKETIEALIESVPKLLLHSNTVRLTITRQSVP